MMDMHRFIVVGMLVFGSLCRGEPVKLCDENPHYLSWRGKAVILITSGEHYGAVLNSAFDYKTYLKVLGRDGMNLTRTFSGAYCEPVGAFKIKNNTLAPAEGKLICPWARSEQAGYANGGNKFDLTKWDAKYFARLRDFVAEADKQGVVVELVMFCPFYKDEMWDLSPMNASNNVNGIGKMKRTDVYTLKDAKLQAVQDEMVRRIVRELKGFDNLYYEICNEPYFGGVTLEWQRHIARVIARTEKELGVKHLIAQNIANKTKKITDGDPLVSIFNFHYARPPAAVAENYGLNKVLGDDETGFSGSQPKAYRLEAWDFIIAGGGIYNNLDYSFYVGHADGKGKIDAPGGGGVVFRRQMAILRDFMHGFDFAKMSPDNDVIKGGEIAKKTTVRALSHKGKAYAVYVNGGGLTSLVVELPKGKYRAEWVDTKTGDAAGSEVFDHGGGQKRLRAPKYSDDIALRIVRVDGQRRSLLFDGGFEGGSLDGWKISGNRPAVTKECVRAGKYAMKTSLDRHKDKVAYRTEVSGPGSEVGKEYWYGFSIFLPADYVPDKVWEIVAQWHGVPDFKIGENWRNPVAALSTTGGRWGFVNRWDSKRNTFEGGKRRYDGGKNYDLGPYQRRRWTDWVVHVKWSYGKDGVLELFKDGRRVVNQQGPNTFNDAKGPYFKMGLYKGWKRAETASDAVSSRVLYHDEFRMAGASGSYSDVAPGGDNWPDFRGPGADGHSDSTGLPLKWSETKNVKWKAPIHDFGYSTPVVWGDQIWLTTAKKNGKAMYAVCIDFETGKVIHDVPIFKEPDPQRVNSLNSYATPSAVLEQGRAYVHFGTYGTACVDTATGKVLWRNRELHCNHVQGPVSSPVIFNDLIIVHLEGIDVQFIAAIDKNTGKILWRTDRPKEIYSNLKPIVYKAYHTPVLVEVDGKTQLVSNGSLAVMGYDPATGKEIWRVVYGDDNTISRIVTGHGLLFVNCGGVSTRLWAVRTGGKGDVTDTHVAWKLADDVPLESSPVLVGDLLYIVSDKGVATCLDAKTGKQVWRAELEGRYGASMIHADGRIYYFNKKGKTTVIKPGRTFEVLAENQIDGGFYASAAVAKHSLILRTKTHLYRIQKP